MTTPHGPLTKALSQLLEQMDAPSGGTVHPGVVLSEVCKQYGPPGANPHLHTSANLHINTCAYYMHTSTSMHTPWYWLVYYTAPLLKVNLNEWHSGINIAIAKQLYISLLQCKCTHITHRCTGPSYHLLILPPPPIFPNFRAPRFKGHDQQDSQELLRYLLDSLRTEEINVSLGTIRLSTAWGPSLSLEPGDLGYH